MKKIDPVFAVLGALSIVQLAASIAICPSLPETIPAANMSPLSRGERA